MKVGEATAVVILPPVPPAGGTIRKVTSFVVCEASYFAEYPDGRRVGVTEQDAKAFGLLWKSEGLRIITVVRQRLVDVYDDCLEEFRP